TSKSGQGIYPVDYISLETRKKGAVILHVFGMLYMFVALAIVCDEFFVPALEVITRRLSISDDVAGATFMAAGGSAPELFTSVIGVFLAKSNVGIGTIVGSAVFNILFVIGMCSLFSHQILQLTWWPLLRDCTFYIISLIVLIVAFSNSYIEIQESIGLMIIYAAYVTFMKFNKPIETWVKAKIGASRHTTDAGKVGPEVRCYGGCGIKTSHSSLSICILNTLMVFLKCVSLIKISDDNHKTSLDKSCESKVEAKSTAVIYENQVVPKSNNPGMTSPHDPPMRMLDSENEVKYLNFRLKLIEKCNPDKMDKILNKQDINSIIRPMFKVYTTTNFFKQSCPEAKPLCPITMKFIHIPEEEMNDTLDLSWPTTNAKRCVYLFIAPIMYALWITLPDVRNPKREKWFMFSFFGSIFWIAGFSYLMVWWAHQVGETIGFSETVMGLTFLAAGTSVPDLITSVIVARKGLGDMAVSSSVGSNIFDVTVGLPFPWFISSVAQYSGEAIRVESRGLFCSILLLFAMLLFVVISIAVCKWRMSKKLGITMLVLYAVFLVLSLLLELSIIECTFNT
uniref:Sodium/calcium exchanger membrane region domain-containing protein n=1 Tax=Ciona savignyi TaxID=51511 RepID=H2YL76_CIOSA